MIGVHRVAKISDALEIGQNLVHGSDSPESAKREIGIFFPGL